MQGTNRSGHLATGWHSCRRRGVQFCMPISVESLVTFRRLGGLG